MSKKDLAGAAAAAALVAGSGLSAADMQEPAETSTPPAPPAAPGPGLASVKPSAPKSDLWRVWDTNATSTNPRTREAVPRIHEPVKGIRYELFAEGEGCPMPSAHALKFLCDEAFVVKNENGQRVPPVPKEAVTRGKGFDFKLEPGQVIASIEELTDDALRARCAMYSGGERIDASSTRRDLLTALGHFQEQAAAQAAKARGDTIASDEAAGIDGLKIADVDEILKRPSNRRAAA